MAPHMTQSPSPAMNQPGGGGGPFMMQNPQQYQFQQYYSQQPQMGSQGGNYQQN